MRNAIRASDSLQIAKSELLLSRTVIDTMTAALGVRDKTIAEQDKLNRERLKIIDNLDRQNISLTKSNQLSLDYNSYIKKQLRLQKRKTVIISGVSISVIGTLTYLLLNQ